MGIYFSKKRFNEQFGANIPWSDEQSAKWSAWHYAKYADIIPPTPYRNYLKEYRGIEIPKLTGAAHLKLQTKKCDTTPLTKEQSDHIVNDFKNRQNDLRMAALCKLMWNGGLRISDVLHSLTKEQVYMQDGTIRNEILLNDQKTGKPNSVFVYELGSKEEKRGELYFLLKEYLPLLKNISNDAPLFYNKKLGTPIGERGVNDLLSQFVGQMNIEQCSCHCFRKGAGTHLGIRKKHPVQAVQKFLNHSNEQTTRLYIKLKASDQEAINKELDL